MLTSTALLVFALVPVVPHSPPAGPGWVQTDKKAEYEKRLAAAEGNAEKLWQLYEWCSANGLDKDGKNVLRKIVKLDGSDRKAHELLGEIEYDGKWFPSEKKVEEYKKKKLEEEAKRTGKVIYKGELVDPADVPFLEKGMVKDSEGRWVDAEEQKKITEGWKKQDLEWVAPADLPNLEKGLWKCGDKWLSEADANTFHAELDRWWKIPADHFLLYTTCDRALAMKVRDEAERAYREVVRALGRAPTSPVPVLILRSQAQYGEFASQRQSELRPNSSIHGATIAEVWVEPLQAGMTSAGFGYWDASNDKDNRFGPMFVRHAAAQSLAESVDPSPKTLASLVANRGSASTPSDWWAEKQLPEWLRYGTCAYAERYLADATVNAGGDPFWMRKWSIENIANKGGIDPLDTILACNLSDPANAGKLINETGLLLSFILDGKCAPVVQAHQAFKDAFKNGKNVKAAAKALEDAVRKNEDALRKYAGI